MRRFIIVGAIGLQGLRAPVSRESALGGYTPIGVKLLDSVYFSSRSGHRAVHRVPDRCVLYPVFWREGQAGAGPGSDSAVGGGKRACAAGS